jgi:putative transposase
MKETGQPGNIPLLTSGATSVATPRKGKLPRLEKHRYQGHAVVFWTNTLEERARGWLTPAFHATFRQLMLHAAAREHLFCPAYCLMPDHLHLLWMGMRRESDQLNAMKFLRTHLEPALGKGREWQHQPHDHVLRDEERQRNAFARFCFYTLANPVRAGLVAAPVAAEVTRRISPEPSASSRRRLPGGDWPYCGAIIPGYPDLHPLADGYWELFWKLYVSTREAEPSPPSVPPLK